MLITVPNPEMRVFCAVCKWRGQVKDALVIPDDLVRCPKCEYAVDKSNEDLPSRD